MDIHIERPLDLVPDDWLEPLPLLLRRKILVALARTLRTAYAADPLGNLLSLRALVNRSATIFQHVGAELRDAEWEFVQSLLFGCGSNAVHCGELVEPTSAVAVA